MTAATVGRFTLPELWFIAARVKAEVKANPPRGPLLGEPAPRKTAATCKRGHDRADRVGLHCLACKRERQRQRRAEGAAW